MAENTPILEELVSLRHELATLLGYKNHAAYIQEVFVRHLQLTWLRNRPQCSESSGEVCVF